MGIKNKKEWYDRRSRRIADKPNKKRKSKKSNSNVIEKKEYEQIGTVVNEYKAPAPTVFSFWYNTEKTAEMFNGIIKEIEKGVFQKRFFIDSSKVEKATTDVLVYLIAIMRNMKYNNIKKHTFAGNLPVNERAKKVFEESGLYKYVQTKCSKLPNNTEKMQIVSGKNTDTVLASEICRFVMEKFSVDHVYTQFLYKTIIELMSNAVHHAYHDKEEIMWPCWYLYAEYIGVSIRFIFIDTGLGIATTVKKKMIERLTSNDAKLLESAFKGEFRTETQQANRGLGLPALREYALNNKFSEFFVLSGNGGYKYKREIKGFEKYIYKNKIYGTIYIFEMMKMEDRS